MTPTNSSLGTLDAGTALAPRRRGVALRTATRRRRKPGSISRCTPRGPRRRRSCTFTRRTQLRSRASTTSIRTMCSRRSRRTTSCASGRLPLVPYGRPGDDTLSSAVRERARDEPCPSARKSRPDRCRRLARVGGECGRGDRGDGKTRASSSAACPPAPSPASSGTSCANPEARRRAASRGGGSRESARRAPRPAASRRRAPSMPARARRRRRRAISSRRPARTSSSWRSRSPAASASNAPFAHSGDDVHVLAGFVAAARDERCGRLEGRRERREDSDARTEAHRLVGHRLVDPQHRARRRTRGSRRPQARSTST